MRYFLLTLTFLSYLAGNAQQWERAKAFAYLPQNSNYQHVTDGQGNIYIFGQINAELLFIDNIMLTTDGCKEIFMTKLDSNFTVVWAKSFKNTTEVLLTGIAQDKNGDIIITGNYSKTFIFGKDTLKALGFSDVFLAKLDTGGNVKWAKSCGSMDRDASGQVYCDDKNNIYVSGTFGDGSGDYSKPMGWFDNISVTSFGAQDIFVAQFSSSGYVKWVKNFGSNNRDNGNLVLSNGYLYVCGGRGPKFQYDNSYFQDLKASDISCILKMDTSGHIQWINGVSTMGFGFGGINSIAVDLSENVYLLGGFACGSSTYQSGGGCTLNLNNLQLPGNGNHRKFIAKLDKNGNAKWLKNFEPGIYDTEKFIILNNNHFIFIDRYQIYEIDSNAKHVDYASQNVDDYQYSSDLNAIRDGKLTIVGEYKSGELKLGDITLPKSYKPYSMYVARANFVSKPAGIKNKPEIKYIRIYPNPADNLISIEFPKDNKESYFLKIYSAQGQLLEELLPIGNLVFDSQKYNSGFYLFVFSNGRESETHKISIQH